MLLRGIENHEGRRVGYTFYCPGCKNTHLIYTLYYDKEAWKFNGNLEKPTFTPSYLVHENPNHKRCHLHIVDGKLKYETDSQHELAGKTVDMVEITDES